MTSRLRTLRPRWALLAVGSLLLAGCAYAPEKEIPPHPDYIAAAVDPEDEITIETVDGRRVELVVAEVTPDAVVGTDGTRVSIARMRRLTIRSWTDPEHPCGAGEPVGCSIPAVVTEVSKYHVEYGEKFHSACVHHDYCYRHGYATYGYDQRFCDDRFYADMKAECDDSLVKVALESLADVDKLAEGAKCRLAADQFYEAVRRHGHKAFRTTTSTVCEFDWSPPAR